MVDQDGLSHTHIQRNELDRLWLILTWGVFQLMSLSHLGKWMRLPEVVTGRGAGIDIVGPLVKVKD